MTFGMTRRPDRRPHIIHRAIWFVIVQRRWPSGLYLRFSREIFGHGDSEIVFFTGHISLSRYLKVSNHRKHVPSLMELFSIQLARMAHGRNSSAIEVSGTRGECERQRQDVPGNASFWRHPALLLACAVPAGWPERVDGTVQIGLRVGRQCLGPHCPVDDGVNPDGGHVQRHRASFAGMPASTCRSKHESAASSPITADSVIATTWIRRCSCPRPSGRQYRRSTAPARFPRCSGR